MKSFFSSLFFLVALSGAAQEIYSRMDASREAIRIGEQFSIRLSIHSPGEMAVENLNWPEFPSFFQDSLLEIISTEQQNKQIKSNGENIIYQDYLVTCFDSAYLELAPVVVTLNGVEYPSNPLEITVQTIEVDTAAGPKDIKGIFTAEYTWKDRLMEFLNRILENWYWFIAGLVILIIFIAYISKKRRAPAAEEIIFIPPKQEALMLLSQLEEEQLPEKGELKLYYSRITDIIRNFLERRFDFNAPELSSHEIIRHLKSIKCNKESVALIREIFEISDLVKFAKGKTSYEESKRALDLSRKMIHSIPDPEVIAEAEVNK